jgi:hypothetical protein
MGVADYTRAACLAKERFHRPPTFSIGRRTQAHKSKYRNRLRCKTLPTVPKMPGKNDLHVVSRRTIQSPKLGQS